MTYYYYAVIEQLQQLEEAITRKVLIVHHFLSRTFLVFFLSPLFHSDS